MITSKNYIQHLTLKVKTTNRNLQIGSIDNWAGKIENFGRNLRYFGDRPRFWESISGVMYNIILSHNSLTHEAHSKSDKNSSAVCWLEGMPVSRKKSSQSRIQHWMGVNRRTYSHPWLDKNSNIQKKTGPTWCHAIRLQLSVVTSLVEIMRN